MELFSQPLASFMAEMFLCSVDRRILKLHHVGFSYLPQRIALLLSNTAGQQGGDITEGGDFLELLIFGYRSSQVEALKSPGVRLTVCLFFWLCEHEVVSAGNGHAGCPRR
jgi:hypothetical protein